MANIFLLPQVLRLHCMDLVSSLVVTRLEWTEGPICMFRFRLVQVMLTWIYHTRWIMAEVRVSPLVLGVAKTTGPQLADNLQWSQRIVIRPHRTVTKPWLIWTSNNFFTFIEQFGIWVYLFRIFDVLFYGRIEIHCPNPGGLPQNDSLLVIREEIAWFGL